ncbi:MAG: hypothetical protein AAGB93_13145 [Planctomycetota bacterium]
MRAETHTEVYRRFHGTLRRRPLRSLTLAWSGVRIGFRKKLPVLLLYAIPLISTIVTSFVVQFKFDAESGQYGSLGGRADGASVLAAGLAISNQLGEVSDLIFNYLLSVPMLSVAVLAMGWFGSGLISEDKRLRAHLLYFARPMTRWTYMLGKLGTVVFWGAMAIVVPITIVCGVAAFTSPDWSFVTQRWDVILRLELFGVLWILVHGLLVLAISSMVDRRNHAIAGLFGFYFLAGASAEAMTIVLDDSSWRLLSIPRNFERIFNEMLGRNPFGVEWGIEATVWVLGGLSLACILVLARQTKRMEVGA